MSLAASIVALLFRLKPKQTEEAFERELDERKNRPMPASRAPRGIQYRLENRPDGDVFYLNEESGSDRTVFYLHGGAYIHDFSPFHWRYLKKLIKATGTGVIAPAYKLAPHGTFRDAFGLIVPLYTEYRKQHPEKKVILMGDSAGGGLALALCEHFLKEGILPPDELILFSPWTDVTMTNPKIRAYEAADPWITPSYRAAGLRFADGADPADYRVNPIHGDMSGIRNVLLVTGTREILYPDTMLLWEKLKAEPSNELYVGEGMIHVFPLIPIPEAKEPTRRVIERITRQEESNVVSESEGIS